MVAPLPALTLTLTLPVQVMVGPVPPSLMPQGRNTAHGAGMLPLPLPQLLQLTQAAAEELLTNSSTRGGTGGGTGGSTGGGTSDGGSGGGTLGPALMALINGIEDVFTSPGTFVFHISHHDLCDVS